jgi:hypothetical protein
MKSVLSQVPECEGPGAPIVVINLHPGTRATRRSRAAPRWVYLPNVAESVVPPLSPPTKGPIPKRI